MFSRNKWVNAGLQRVVMTKGGAAEVENASTSAEGKGKPRPGVVVQEAFALK